MANGDVYVGSYDNQTYALNAETGALIWKVPTGYDQCVQASPGYANGLVYTGGSFDNNVYALDASAGATKWHYLTGGGIFTSPAIAGNIEFVGSLDKNVRS